MNVTVTFLISVSGRRRLRARSDHGIGQVMNDRHAHHSEMNRLATLLGLTLAKQIKTAQRFSHHSRMKQMQNTFLHRQMRQRHYALDLEVGE